MTITELAHRNRAQRMSQLTKLRPLVKQARASADSFIDAKNGVKDIRQGIETMSKLKYIPNLFPTPKWLVERMIQEAGTFAGRTCLEPSAGKGDIADALHEGKANLMCIEIVPALVEIVRKKGHDCVCGDFLEIQGFPSHSREGYFRIVMNPPFERGIDEDHIRHAFKLLAPGGRLAAICCSTTGRKLREWAEENEGFVEDLPEGSFATSDRPTNVNTCLLVVNKPS